MTVKSSPDSCSFTNTYYRLQNPTFSIPHEWKWVNAWNGTDDVKWREKIANHENATNPVTASKSFFDMRWFTHTARVETVLGPGHPSWHQLTGTHGYPEYSWNPPNLPLTIAHSATATGIAVGGFNAKLDELRTGFTGLTFLGELREGLTMIKQRTKQLCRSIESTKKRLKRFFDSDMKRRILTKEASSLWLEYSFGWLPLMRDIQSAVGNLYTLEPKYRVIAKTGEDVSGGTPKYLRTYNDYTGTLLCDIYESDKTVSQVKCCAEVSMELLGLTEAQGLYFRDGAEHWGLSLRDFIPTVWELLPYSFLVDYFINVGDVVAAPWMDRSAITWQYQVSRTTRIIEGSFRNLRSRSFGGTTPIDIQACPGAIRVGTKRFDRAKTVTVIPPFYLHYPEMGNLRWANLLALWTNKTLITR